MNDTFSSAGVKAGIENRLQVLRIAPTSEVSEMKKMYGKVTRSRSTVVWNFSGRDTNPGAVT